MKAEDYFKVYKIVRDDDKRRRFTDTFFLTARRWAEQLPDTVTNYDFDPDNEDSKKTSIKYQFLQRFAVKGRTTEAMYTAWMQLSFDSSKDDIEEFINEVKNLAKRLGYNKQAQVMAIKNHLPLELYHNCLTINNLKDLTDFLVKVYDNPKMKEKLGVKDKALNASGVTMHAFSMGQSLDTHIMDSSGEIGKLKAEIGELKFQMQAVNSDSKAKVQKFKPKITPPRRMGSNFHGGESFGNRGQSRRTQETTNETKTMGHSGLEVRIFPVGVTRVMAQIRTKILDQMVDSEAKASLIIVQMYDALGWLVELLIKIRADVITARNLDISLVNVLRKLKTKGDKQGTTLWAKEYLSLKAGRSKNGMMTMLGVLSI